MRHKMIWSLLISGCFLVMVGVILLVPASQAVKAHPAVAQCGSQASSCKSCHEVQAEMPVNNDGTGWHESHAFGDFCIFCHAGNEQATDAVAAHTGMVPPLSDIESACQLCHADDLMDRAQVYATILNVELGSGDSTPIPIVPTSLPADSPVQPTPQSPIVEPTPQSSVSVPINNEIVVNDPNVVDYVQRYNEIVLGERPVNWGNIALVGLIGLVVVGGGGFVIFNELRLRLPSSEMRTVEGAYEAEVVEMLPAIARLKSQTRKALRNLLNNPGKTDKVLNLIDTLASDEEPEERKP